MHLVLTLRQVFWSRSLVALGNRFIKLAIFGHTGKRWDDHSVVLLCGLVINSVDRKGRQTRIRGCGAFNLSCGFTGIKHRSDVGYFK